MKSIIKNVQLKRLAMLAALPAFLYCSCNKKVAPTVAPEQTIVYRNPIIKDKFTADPAALVHNNKVYIFAGHDEAPIGVEGYVMHKWLCYSSTNMATWQEHDIPLKAKDFSWATGDAWASHVVERNGKFYWYATVSHATIPGKAIGVAVADKPEGPYRDARGTALITNDMTTDIAISWDDIDPAVFIDDDGQAYLFWGNTTLHYAKLKNNMTELDGDFKTIPVNNFTEAPWVHKHNDWYYLSYAYQFPEKIAYSMSRNINGPWEFKGILNDVPANSNTNHQAIIDFKGKSYFIYHNGSISPNGGNFRRSVCIDELHYNADGTIKKILMTPMGVAPVN